MKNRKEEKFRKKDEKWLQKYGVKYTDSISKKESQGQNEQIKNRTNKKDKAKNQKSYTKIMLQYAGKHRGSYITFFLFGILSSCIAIFEPFFLEKIITDITNANFEKITTYALFVGLVMIVVRLLNHLSANLINSTYHKQAANLRKYLNCCLLNTKISKYDSTPSGEITARVIGDADGFSAGLVNRVSSIPEILLNVVYVGYAVYINIWLALILLCGGLLKFCIEMIYTNKFSIVQRRRNNLIWDKVYSLVGENVRGVRDLKCLGGQKIASKKFDNVINHLKQAQSNNASSFQMSKTVHKVFDIIILLTFIILGIELVKDNIITIGAFIVLFMYREKVSQFFDTISEFYNTVKNIEVDAERIYEITSEEHYPKDKFGIVELDSINGKIEFKNVEFSYNDDKKILKGLNLNVNPNQCIGIVGKTGQGKSTLISLLSRMYDSQSGEILIDGVNIHDLTEKCLRDNISIVPQTPYIFNDSFKENLLSIKSNATQEEIEDVCKKAFLHDYIISLKDGYDTKLGEGGVTLSGGQRQRLAIARALLKDSKILILDEATSAADNETQSLIMNEMSKVYKNRTVIIIAHRLSTIINCDKIVLIDDGKVFASGTHKELMEDCPEYQALYLAEENK